MACKDHIYKVNLARTRVSFLKMLCHKERLHPRTFKREIQSVIEASHLLPAYCSNSCSQKIEETQSNIHRVLVLANEKQNQMSVATEASSFSLPTKTNEHEMNNKHTKEILEKSESIKDDEKK